ncbi:MAG: DUF3298 domain-containing protein [Bacteroidota bacterium]
MKKFVLFTLVFSLLNSCISDPKKTELDSNTYKLEGHPTVQANVVFVRGEGQHIDKINEVIIDSTIGSIFPDKPLESVPAALEEFVNNYKTFKKDFPETEQIWELSVETEVVFQSETVITYSISTYSFTGGAHGNDRIILLNFNPITGEHLKNSDLFKDTNAFLKIAKETFIESQKANNPLFSLEDYFFGEDFRLPENMGYSDDGFILLYNIYEIASYAQGYTEFAIPFEALNGLLNIAPY